MSYSLPSYPAGGVELHPALVGAKPLGLTAARAKGKPNEEVSVFSMRMFTLLGKETFGIIILLIR